MDSYVTPEQAAEFLESDDSEGVPVPAAYIKRAAKMIDKHVVFEERCLCGADDDSTGTLLRVDIVCPKHDGLAG